MAGNPNSLPPALGTGLWWWDAVAGIWSPVSGTTPLPVDATVSASVDGFAPNGSTATLAVTTSTGRVALPAGTVVLVSNTGSTTAFAKLGSGSVTAATTDIPIFGNSTIAMTVGANVDLAAITASGTTTLNLQGGTGLYAGSGGGSASGGGGGGAVTIADGADVAQGSIADAAWSGSGNGTVVSLLKKAISYLAGSFTIQGTVAATGTVGASQVSTWTMQPGNTANTTPWLVDINGGTAAAQSGFITSTGTAAATIIASPGTGVALFIGSAQFSNTSTAQAVVTLSDTKSTQLIVPANGGSNVTFQPPLPLAANTPLTFTTSAATTTILASAQGHKA